MLRVGCAYPAPEVGEGEKITLRVSDGRRLSPARLQVLRPNPPIPRRTKMRTLLIRVPTLSSIAVLCILASQPIVPPAEAAPPPGYTLIWSDEFTGTAMDTTKWGYLLLGDQFGKFDEGCNDSSAVSLDGQGNLVIRTWTEHNSTCGSLPVGTYNKTGMIATGD